jgi:hypothetical protein
MQCTASRATSITYRLVILLQVIALYIYQVRSVARYIDDMLAIMLFPTISYRRTVVHLTKINQVRCIVCFLRFLGSLFYLTNIVCHHHHPVTRADSWEGGPL